MKIHKSAKKAIDLLEEKGYEAYLVGGCVRDAIMGNTPHDWDICTEALPEEVVRIFHEYTVIETGLQHGTVTVVIEGTALEITSYRSDGEYEDNRRPKEVQFVSSLKEDVSRRDFRMNALAYHPEKGIIDYFDGVKDIEEKVLRAVGNPNKRFEEDGLRILRALRFASRLGFSISKDLSEAIHEKKECLRNISSERIYSEFVGIIQGEYCKDILLEYRDVIAVFIPEIEACFDFSQNNPYHQYDVYRHSIESVSLVEKEVLLRLTMFFHDIGKPSEHSTDEKGIDHFYGHSEASVDITRAVLNHLKVDNETKKMVLALIKWHDAEISHKKILKWLNRLGEKTLNLLLKVKKADILAQADVQREERLLELLELEKGISEAILKDACFSLRQLMLNGRDLMAIGIKGKEIGETLEEVLQAVIDGKIENDPQLLMEYVRERKRNAS